ncbi:MAG: 16S rRNA (uracil(1498)-N(3))-methyltransferase [Bacteroidetes bacterium]|nr:MAG: 16S rRNA (uracil(1498)-N(3))-methyltransferase [Bacteroidota bacterium]RLD74719.1 MAG: 16S rRNA (uracil(1498)-N(3))-methyltransferase [Bacteroidota bacterium]
MHIFYTPDIKSDKYTLSEEESKHSVRVLRLQIGDKITLIDGIGGYYIAEITNNHPKRCEIKIIQTEKEYGKRNYHLTMAIAPTKNIDRFEWFLEKSTEIGVDKFIPFISQQSERKVIKPERLDKRINSAIKQSIQAYRPHLGGLVKFKDLINLEFIGKKLIAHCFETKKPYLKDVIAKDESVLILIGPEGDFTMEEVEMAKSKGFREISLGENRLRTETAGIVAVHTVAIGNQ